MKVVIIGKYYPTYRGGIENHIYQLCKELNNSIDIEVLSSNDSFYSCYDSIGNVSVYRAALWGTLFSTPICPGLVTKIIYSKTDLYHIHVPNPIGELALTLKPSIPFIVTYHSDVVNPRLPYKMYLPLLKRTLKLAKTIIVASEPYLKSSPLLQNYKDKCVIIPYGIDLNRFKINSEIKDNIRSYREQYGDRIVLFVGRLRYYKGVEYLIRAMKDINAVLLVVGEGDRKLYYEKMVKEFHIENKVYFLGSVSDNELITLYHSCNVFVLPSVNRGESFGMVLLEAMACSKPVISTELGTGTSWVNLNGITGYVVPPFDSAALINVIVELLNDREKAGIMGEDGNKRVRENFNSTIMCNNIFSIYQQYLKK